MKNITNNWLIRLLGLQDSRQQAKTDEATQYAHEKKEAFTDDMEKIHADLKKLRAQAKKSIESGHATLQIAEDITQKIAIVTDKRRIKK